jgi:hypothetical protein
MAQVQALNNFNNLLFHRDKQAIANELEHRAGRVPLDLSYKKPSPVLEILTADKSQLNGRHSRFNYEPHVSRSRPLYGYDSRIDDTLLRAISDKYVNVSGLLVPARDFKKDRPLTFNPPKRVIGIIR